MIRSSPELLAVSRRWYEILRTKTNTEELRDFLTTSDELRFIGTGEGEFWSGSAVRDGVGGFFAAIPAPVVFEELEAEAFENGETGWSSFVHRIQFVGFDEAVIYRTVVIFVLEGASWKIVNRHASVPTPNIELVGVEQLAIQQLIDAAREEGPELIQSEGLASVLFTDVEGSTALAEALGDQSWSSAIESHFQVLAEIIQKHRGQFVKSLGDGTLSIFPSAKEALAAAVDMQTAVTSVSEEPHLGLRIGIHTGDVVQSRGDFFGTVVNKASRITTAGVAGEILISDATRAMVGGRTSFCFSDTEPRQLKGLSGRHTLYRLEWKSTY
ncbi:adenylate/guanylate cyclase domain-containing protein [Ruegeria arenilitoris]|uniref:adenylate/guanylate cyclase domain-containing protein n=1 Tax=Ruegeria arenilitoris TaxID=1173585 RepID=UPI00147A02D6|nr:adenylate/guanylate cyclase domain-containing protein [Ruegeria arenilitoris]